MFIIIVWNEIFSFVVFVRVIHNELFLRAEATTEGDDRKPTHSIQSRTN